MDFLKGNIGLVIVGLLGLVLGALIFGSNGSEVEELDKRVEAKLKDIGAKLKTLDVSSGKVDDVASKVTSVEGKVVSLQDSTTPLNDKVSALSSEIQSLENELKSVSGNVGELENAAEKARHTIAGRVAALEEKLKVALANLKTTDTPTEKTGGVAIAGDDGVKLALTQSAWLEDRKLNVVLSYIYPGEKKVRVGVAGRLIDLPLDSPKGFRFEDQRCQIEFKGMTEGLALLQHSCSS